MKHHELYEAIVSANQGVEWLLHLQFADEHQLDNINADISRSRDSLSAALHKLAVYESSLSQRAA